jgi:hypothetical protein
MHRFRVHLEYSDIAVVGRSLGSGVAKSRGEGAAASLAAIDISSISYYGSLLLY